MADILSVRDVEIEIHYGVFSLLGTRPGDLPEWSTEELFSSVFVVAAGGGPMIIFRSGRSEHDVSVRVELWSDEPRPPPDRVWAGAETKQSAVVMGRNTSGKCELRIGLGFGEFHADADPIPTEEGTYRIDARVIGRAAARTQSVVGSEGKTASGLERWLIRVWPAH